ncbi:fibronectin type III domain-containing protein 11 [Phaenicophaeus curvirostris]|uniref:fibronectin type III domain-containing protein 11 n=1 Tax=Phaenicophaeus curvirostris TaxID=33595 RepID=UPI0037F09C2E
MAGISDESHTSLEIAVPSKGHDDASQQMYMEKRNFVLQILQTTMSPHHIQHYRNKFEVFKKCYFYVDIEPRHVHARDQNHVMHCTDIMQLIDPYQLLKIKKKAKNQIEIEMLLIAELLEQLEQGREELRRYIMTCDMITFLAQWPLISKRLHQLSKFMATLVSLDMPGKLHIKHHLLLHADLRGTRLPRFRVSLRVKMPLIFDRKGSFACKNSAKLKWFDKNQEPHLKPYELHFKLLTSEIHREMGYSRIQEATSTSCVVQGLLPGRSYEFRIGRPDTQTFILVKWHDSITLTTTTEDAVGSACAAE